MAGRFVLVLLLGSVLTACQYTSRFGSDVAPPLGPSAVEAKSGPGHPIRITSGHLASDARRGIVELKGTAGFRFTASVSSISGQFLPTRCAGSLDCQPGDSVNLRAFWVGNDLTGTATLRGKTYSDVGGVGLTSPSASVEFAGSLTVPPFTPDGMVDVSAPFTFSGHFSYVEDGIQRREELVGHGTASLRFQRDSLEGDAWVFTSALYTFEASNR